MTFRSWVVDTPPGEYVFDVIVTVNDKKFTIKDVHHINFNHPNAPDILGEHHGKGEYPSPKSFPTDYTYKVNFTQGGADNFLDQR